LFIITGAAKTRRCAADVVATICDTSVNKKLS